MRVSWHLEQNPAKNWFQSKQQVSFEFLSVKAALPQLNFVCKHSHKELKDSLETRAELAILRTDVENQAILEPILLYRASKYKSKSRAVRTVSGLIFLPFHKIIVSFFSFLCQDANKARSKCAIIGCNLSKKHKLTLYKTQNREPNYVHHKFFFNFY